MTSAQPHCDVLVLGGGVAGLWTLRALTDAGYTATLLESEALGSGQTVPCQGIIHGGGKYALRSVRDYDAVRAIRGMPARWQNDPLLRTVSDSGPTCEYPVCRSRDCWLWVPHGGLLAKLQAWGLLPIVARAGLLNARPRIVPKREWPPALQGSAQAVYRMEEPVVDTQELMRILAASQAGRVFRYASGDAREPLSIEMGADGSWSRLSVTPTLGSAPVALHPRAVVLAAGEGNEQLLDQAGLTSSAPMQRRPLLMFLLRGPLPPLFGHCIASGRTRITVTSASDGGTGVVWQIGGAIAERFADTDDIEAAKRAAVAELRELLPAIPLDACEVAAYRAVRAEGASAGHARPSGVQLGRVAPNVFVGWPTKMALAPIFADEVVSQVRGCLNEPSSCAPWPQADWEVPAPAALPWEQAEWTPVE